MKDEVRPYRRSDLPMPMEPPVSRGFPVERGQALCVDFHPQASNACERCQALASGRNCWDMALSPCGDLSRERCETCAVYGAIMRALALTGRVCIEPREGLVVEGDVLCHVL